MNSLYRTMFFVPGNDPKKIVGAEIYQPDCIIYDLEDSVSVFEKDSARILVEYALRCNRPNCRVGIRINQADSPYYKQDVCSMVPLKPDFLRLPKAETAEDIKNLDSFITEIEEQNAIEAGSIKIVASIETALGVINSYNIASASTRMLAIGLGAEDFRTDMRMERSETGAEILFARNMIALNAHAAGITAMDYVYSNIKNDDGFREDVRLGKQLGYTGKSVVHPNQIAIVHEMYTPTEKAINDAKEILNAYEEALKNASGVTAVNGKMIDKPMVTRAMSVLSYAKAAGMEV
ncbi:aldolase/citrate lyase family protein [uncultured Phascolarctobacterium sp.]|uniref:HpcH/HpaI aldolase/citrate lyase family protein n=1 Tax=Phascolarctobacterium sp. TaxID=2049039 RepID=UPI0025D28D0B|nr:aldolase/citrate lyase family protein [uncultured Phascolarctobacterium sp.]